MNTLNYMKRTNMKVYNLTSHSKFTLYIPGTEYLVISILFTA